MASFASTFPFPAPLHSMRPSPSIHPPAARLHFPDFPNLCSISKGSTVKARKLERATWGRTPVPQQPGISDLVSLSRGEKGARPDLAKHLLSPKILRLLAAGNAPSPAFQNHSPACHRGNPAGQAYLTATSTFAPRPWPAAYQLLTPYPYSTQNLSQCTGLRRYDLGQVIFPVLTLPTLRGPGKDGKEGQNLCVFYGAVERIHSTHSFIHSFAQLHLRMHFVYSICRMPLSSKGLHKKGVS